MSNQIPATGIRFPAAVKAKITAEAAATGVTFTAMVLVLCTEALDTRYARRASSIDAEHAMRDVDRIWKER